MYVLDADAVLERLAEPVEVGLCSGLFDGRALAVNDDVLLREGVDVETVVEEGLSVVTAEFVTL